MSRAERLGDEPIYPTYKTHGLTKREEFAKAAMQGLSANPSVGLELWQMAKWSVEMADKLIEHLEKEAK